jgi:hypothetical protein
MKPVGVLGALLIVGGAIVLILKGISFIKDKDSVDLGVVEVSKTEKGFIPPVVGAIAVGVGLILLLGSRRRA